MVAAQQEPGNEREADEQCAEDDRQEVRAERRRVMAARSNCGKVVSVAKSAPAGIRPI
ncbi:hypothetical protein [Streptomyces monashensis]|uniref:hypothetical protein n=1 Tax=Streptomyces monashensis TaxID=1678012 RepID=UPI0015A5B09E|nr:hypothetical protein [Streptomyces monashensis]